LGTLDSFGGEISAVEADDRFSAKVPFRAAAPLTGRSRPFSDDQSAP